MKAIRIQSARIATKQSATKTSLLLLIVSTIAVYGWLDSLETILDQWGCHNPCGSWREEARCASWLHRDIQEINGTDDRPQFTETTTMSANQIHNSDNFEDPSWCRYIHLGRIRIIFRPFGPAQAIRLLRLDAPKSIQAGQPVRMRCLYEVGRGDKLQSLAWYKNGREFYRYQPYERKQPVLAFNLTGVNVDMSKSRNSTVVLVNTTHETSGRYRCEATGTSFQEVNMETFINVIMPANSRGIQTSISKLTQVTFLLISYLCWMMLFV